MKESPLHSQHLAHGARMVEFAGWSMPIQYGGIIKEHVAVREAAGVFDISHMGELFVRGQRSGEWLNGMLTNNVSRLEPGQGQYTMMLNEDGGVIDDLIIYRTGADEFLLVVNAARCDEDEAWLREHLSEGVELENQSDAFGALAIQGPAAAELYGRMVDGAAELPARNEVVWFDSDEGPVFVCRTGYTGEDGFELFCPAAATPGWFTKAIEEGEDLGVRPCGLGARDTLRLEMCYPLNGSDLSRDRTPLQAGLGFFVDLDKGDFVGRGVLAAQKEKKGFDRLVAIQLDEKGPPPRPHYGVFSGEDQIGELTSGTLSPSVGVGIGMAYLPTAHAKIGTEIAVDIRGRRHPAKVVKKPFLKR